MIKDRSKQVASQTTRIPSADLDLINLPVISSSGEAPSREYVPGRSTSS